MLHDILNVLSAGPLLDRSCTLWTVNATLLGSPGLFNSSPKAPPLFTTGGIAALPRLPAKKAKTIPLQRMPTVMIAVSH
jgi:hypothetical protein